MCIRDSCWICCQLVVRSKFDIALPPLYVIFPPKSLIHKLKRAVFVFFAKHEASGAARIFGNESKRLCK